MPCLHQGSILFMKLDSLQGVRNQLDQLHLGTVLFDQFGVLADGQKYYHDTLLLDHRVLHSKLEQNVCMVLAAFQNTQTSYLTDVSRMQTAFGIQGGEHSRKIIAAMWATVCDQDTLKHMQVKVRVFHLPASSQVVFEHSYPIPAAAFAVLLTVLATRRLLDALTRVVLKWRTKVIWDGSFDASVHMTTIAALCQVAFFPVLLGRCMRLIHLAKQCCNVTVGHLWKEARQDFLTIHMIEECSGGTGNKESQRTWIRNSLAGTLLEQGFSMEWVASTTETLMTKVGNKGLIQVAKLPPGKQRLDTLLKICEDCSLKPPAKVAQAANKAVQRGVQQPRKKMAIQIDPSHYQVQPGLFLMQNDEPAQRTYEIRNKGSGYIMLSMEDALPWIRESQLISADELALVIPGNHDFHTTLKKDVIHIPCKDASQRSVILQATVLQLGEKHVKTPASGQPDIDEQACATIAITFWRDEWKQEEWAFIVDKPFAFIRQQLAAQGHEDLLLATWGKSLRHERQPTSEQHASSVQVHATLPKEKLRSLLVISGFNRMWVTPKSQNGRLDVTWRIIWVEGTWAHLNSQASKVTGCAGLVRSRKSFGLRFSAVDYETAWKVINPDRPVPAAHDTSNVFQVQSLPYGCNADMLRKWSEAIGWEFKPLKALGPTAWLVGSQNLPPSEFLTFNAKPVLVKLIPPKDSVNSSPIIAGPLPSKTEQSNVKAGIARGPLGGPPGFDPWAMSAQNKGLPAAFPRDQAGPSEMRFTEQDAKIEAQNQKLAVMEQALEQLKIETKTGFEQVQERERATSASSGSCSDSECQAGS